MEKVKIYGLADPNTCRIRYIGRTTKKQLKHRLIEHISKSKYFNRYYPDSKATHKVNWVNSLLADNKEPIIKLITTVEGWSESHKKERELISKHKDKRGLVNADDRGEGELNKVISDEQKKDISIKIKQNYLDGYENPANKKLECFDIEGNYIKDFKSIVQASKELKIHETSIIRVLQRKHKQIKGFQFRYKGEEREINKVVYDNKKEGNYKEVIVEDLETKTCMKFASVKGCAIYFKLPSPSITQILQSKKKLYKSRYKFSCPSKTDLKLESLEVGNQLPTTQSLTSSVEVQRLDDSKDI